MSIDVSGIKSIIRECMQELKEACGGPNPAHSGAQSGYPINMEEPPDEDMHKGMWRSFKDEALGPDDRFRRKYVLIAIGDNPKIFQSMLGAIDEEQELQEELYKAVDELRRSRE